MRRPACLTVLLLLLLCGQVLAEDPVPTDGLIAWFAADALDLEEWDPVLFWPDLSGSEHHAIQDAEALAPFFVESASPSGLPAVRFDTSALYVEEMGERSPPNTAVLVWQVLLDTGTCQNAFDAWLDDRYRYRIVLTRAIDNELHICSFGTGTWPGDTPRHRWDVVPFEVPLVTTAVYDPAGGVLRVDGEVVDTRPTGDGPLVGLMIGARFTEMEQYLAGDIFELIFYDRRLPDEEIEQVEAYLREKWF